MADYARGKALYTRKNYDKAREEFLAAVEKNPDDGNSWYFLGEIEKNRNNFAEAEKAYASAVNGRLEKKLINLAFWNLTVLVERRGDPLDIVRTCRLFHEKTGSSEPLKKIDSLTDKLLWTDNAEAQKLYQEGAALRKAKDHRGAAEKLNAALAAAPEFLAPRYELAMILYDRKDMAGAAVHLAAVADRIPFYYDANRLLADIYFSLSSFGPAAKYYGNCLEFLPMKRERKSTILFNRGVCHYNLKDYDAALADFAECSRLDPGKTEVLYYQSAIFISREQYPEALTILRKLESAKGGDPQLLMQIGSLYYRQNNREYVSYFDRLFDAVKSSSDRRERYTKAFVILAKHHFESRAYQRFTEIAYSLPESAREYDMRIMLGRAEYESGNFGKAIAALESVSAGTDDSIILAQAYLKDGNRIKAKELTRTLHMQGHSDKLNASKALKPLLAEITAEERARADKAAAEKAAAAKAAAEKAAAERAAAEKAAAEKAAAEKTQDNPGTPPQ